MDLERKIRDELSRMAQEAPVTSMPPTTRRRIARRRVVLGVSGFLGVLLIGATGALGVGALLDDHNGDRSTISGIPTMATVSCRPQGGVEMPSDVAAQPDGVHLRFEGSPGMEFAQASAHPDGTRLEVTGFLAKEPTEGGDPSGGGAART
ncbi:MAG: hypothetical protein QOH90_1196, partial [Actinomycetota bacterium]|nr:hypothetical protein [Actinomycetota bacterium]